MNVHNDNPESLTDLAVVIDSIYYSRIPMFALQSFTDVYSNGDFSDVGNIKKTENMRI